MLDDGVFHQDSVRLAQRLIELKKTDWSLAPYPLERHSFVQPDAWLDEGRLIASNSEGEHAGHVREIKTPRARGRLAGSGVEAGLGERKASGMHSGERDIRQRTLHPL